MILGDLYASLTILLTVHEGKINLDYFPSTFDFNFLIDALMVEASSYFYSHSLTYEGQHTFPLFDLCVLLTSSFLLSSLC